MLNLTAILFICATCLLLVLMATSEPEGSESSGRMALGLLSLFTLLASGLALAIATLV